MSIISKTNNLKSFAENQIDCLNYFITEIIFNI